MRKLYLVPILHMSADMGSLAYELNEASAAWLGPELWQRHNEAVASFWDTIAQFFASLDVEGAKVYQDGLVADGAAGLEIVKQASNQGSKNFQLIEMLLQRGAVLVRTEDVNLVKQERAHLARILRAKSFMDKEAARLHFRRAQQALLRKRDLFIAKRIDETLNEGETGILFIGAHHNVVPLLASDIRVFQVKDQQKIREYLKVLINPNRRKELQRLIEYFTSPILSNFDR